MKKIVSYKWFFLVSVLILFIDIIFVYINHTSAKKVLYSDINSQVVNVHKSFDTTINIVASNMQMIATYVASEEKVQELFYKGMKSVEEEGGGKGGKKSDFYRKELFNYVQERWDKMKKRFDVRQLHFHLGPGSTSFLRVHRPNKFGDNMDNVRHTIVDANKYKKLTKGFETGRVYSGIRGVTPVFYKVNGKKVHVGALEAGTSFKVIVDTLKRTTNTEFSVYLTKDHMRDNMWKEYVDQRNKKVRPIGGFALEYGTDTSILSFLRSNPKAVDIMEKGLLEIVKENDRYYYYSSFKFEDYKSLKEESGVKVGIVVLKKDITDKFVNFEKNNMQNIAFAIFGFVIIEILLYFSWVLGSRKLVSIINERTEELEDINNNLEILVEKRTAELQEQAKNLKIMIDSATRENLKKEQLIFQQKKFADMGKMISAIAHQWRQPLSALGLYAQDVADAYYHNELDEKYVKDFEKTQIELVNHLSNTINDFSDFFRPEKEKMEFQVVKEVIILAKLVKAQFEKNNIDLEISCTCEDRIVTCSDKLKYSDCEAQNTYVKGYVGEFKQAMLNFLYNSADSVNESVAKGDVDKGEINIIIDAVDDYVEIKVSDNGTGISDEIINDIFDPYFSTKEEGKGTGIGLYMTKLVIEDHMGGSIHVKNNDDSGVTFTVKLKKLLKT